MSRYDYPYDPPTRAELDAAEHDDPLAGLVRCRYGCRVYWVTHDTIAALDHYANVHNEPRPEPRPERTDQP